MADDKREYKNLPWSYDDVTYKGMCLLIKTHFCTVVLDYRMLRQRLSILRNVHLSSIFVQEISSRIMVGTVPYANFCISTALLTNRRMTMSLGRTVHRSHEYCWEIVGQCF